MTPFISDATLRRAVASAIGDDDLASKWDELITAANQAAANEIYTALAAKTFTAAQIQQWDRRVEFNRSLGLFFVGIDGGFMTTYSPTWVEFHDRRKELKAMEAITVNDVLTFPAGTASDGGGLAVSGGQLTGLSVPRRDWSQEF